MRTIKRSSAFKRDYKRVKLTPKYSKSLESLVLKILELLVLDSPLPGHFRDHALSGDWDGYRECHLKPDLLLIYKKVEPNLLKLARLGSHSELFN